MRSNWETYQGKRVFIARYDHLNFEEFRAEVTAAETEIHRQPPNSVPLVLLTEGTIISPGVINILKNTALGVTGARKTIFDILVKLSGIRAMAFENLQAAEDWLVKE